MAPEYRKYGQLSPKVDVYALGKVVKNLMTHDGYSKELKQFADELTSEDC